MWQNMPAYQTITSNPCPHINAQLLLMSGMDCAMRILLCPLVLVVLMMPSLPKHVICKER
jgi:hypothetical protein